MSLPTQQQIRECLEHLEAIRQSLIKKLRERIDRDVLGAKK